MYEVSQQVIPQYPALVHLGAGACRQVSYTCSQVTPVLGRSMSTSTRMGCPLTVTSTFVGNHLTEKLITSFFSRLFVLCHLYMTSTSMRTKRPLKECFQLPTLLVVFSSLYHCQYCTWLLKPSQRWSQAPVRPWGGAACCGQVPAPEVQHHAALGLHSNASAEAFVADLMVWLRIWQAIHAPRAAFCWNSFLCGLWSVTCLLPPRWLLQVQMPCGAWKSGCAFKVKATNGSQQSSPALCQSNKPNPSHQDWSLRDGCAQQAQGSLCWAARTLP